ncbi:MAG: NAD(P)-dependent dehydrogenase (short-subunit alcohol dehydrogenase family) [Hyphomicrobiaceae bacterium]|jgi:NAD(P)-dependent dehydrogenase (short-subunit alcohol dehydrogenase family)
MDLGLDGKSVLITGGASGLGKATALMMADLGTRVVIADLNEETLAATKIELAEVGPSCDAVRLDVRNYEECQHAVAFTVERMGRLDCLINCAGIGGPMSFFAQTDPVDFQTLVAINLMGVINCCHAAAQVMIEQGSGKIVSIASEAGKANEKRMVVYGATKGGVISLTRGLAAELGRYNINVNAVCPGVTRTPMTDWMDGEMEKVAAKFYPLGRLGVPGDIAPTITFLCSDQTSWMTGQAISISGGFGRS